MAKNEYRIEMRNKNVGRMGVAYMDYPNIAPTYTNKKVAKKRAAELNRYNRETGDITRLFVVKA